MSLFFAAVPNVSIPPEVLFHVGPFIITNTQILGMVGTLILLAVFGTVVWRIRRGNTKGRLVHSVVWAFEGLYDTTKDVVGDADVARKVMPLAVTLLFFFLVNNWLELVPFLDAVTWHGAPLIRGVAADMNTTFALAIISMATAQAWAIKRRGFMGNIKRYLVSPFKDPLHSFEGFLEIIAEISRTLALSLRIFGNIFGGEVLLAVIAYLTHWAAPLALPVFYVLELFVGAVQAYVFFMLTVAFIGLGLPHNDPGHEEKAHEAAA